ncbi:hypothetical protein BJX66DRAFT_310765, partial [Aspergillus keveii]
MPWLWEIWSDDLPYFWATVTEQDFRDHEIKGYDVPTDIPYDMIVRMVKSHKLAVEKHLEPWIYPKPLRYRTNWFVLYRNIKKNWNDLKGLRSRKRIWEFQTRLLELINM